VFTLIEVTVILAVLAILAPPSPPWCCSRIVDAKVDATHKGGEAAERGDTRPDRCCGQFGFFGDMGRWPVSFEGIAAAAPGTPLFTTATFPQQSAWVEGPVHHTQVGSGDDAADRTPSGAGTAGPRPGR